MSSEPPAVFVTGAADYFLDVTADACPMTFVRTRLALDRLAPGALLEVRLNAGEPLANVPRAATDLGHQVLGLAPEDPAQPGGVHRLVLRNA